MESEYHLAKTRGTWPGRWRKPRRCRRSARLSPESVLRLEPSEKLSRWHIWAPKFGGLYGYPICPRRLGGVPSTLKPLYLLVQNIPIHMVNGYYGLPHLEETSFIMISSHATPVTKQSSCLLQTLISSNTGRVLIFRTTRVLQKLKEHMAP